MTSRKKLSPTARARVFLAHDGRCAICTRKIAPGEDYDLDHVLPLALGGADEASNLVPVHVDCHRGKGGKTASDIGRIRKADRNAKRHAEAFGVTHSLISRIRHQLSWREVTEKLGAPKPVFRRKRSSPMEEKEVG